MAPKQPVAGPSRPKASAAAQSPPPSSSFSGFNPSRTLFAAALPVLGSAEKLQIWDVANDRVITEWDVEGASKVTSLCWSCLAASRSRKKKARKSGPAEGSDDVVLLTTANGLVVYSSEKKEIVSKVALPATVSAAWSSDHGVILATPTSLLVLSATLDSISHTFSLPPNTPAPTAITLLPTSTSDVLHVLIANAAVVSLHLTLSSSSTTHTSSPLPVATSRVTSLVPLPLAQNGSSFLVVSEDDRTVSQYTLSSPTSQAKLSYRYASPTLSTAHSLALTSDLLSVLHLSGEISLFNIPTELDFSRPKSDSKPSSVKLVEGKDERTAILARVEFSSSDEGALVCGRMAGGGRIKWQKAVYELPEGGLRTATIVKCDAQDLVGAAAGSSTIPLQRFAAPANVAQVPDEDTEDDPSSALPTDVDMADLSLGERLLALPNGTTPVVNGDAAAAKAAPAMNVPVNAASLTRLLVQALHTSDPALLTLCLSHRDPVLIRNTIRKMPAQMALPLLKACVERLGKGKGANRRGGGRGSVQSEQQGRGTVEWVKGVLVERGAILMTMPSLPLHLATLSQLLQTRLQLHQPLLSLSGRLDLALAQISMRRIAAEQALEDKSRTKKEGERYVEGESESEEDDVAIEVGDQDGEIEDIDMRERETDESEEEESEEDSEEEEDDDVLESGSENGLLDLDAESGSESGTASEEED
ncbi:U3 small nucleolar RNA-associated protein 5, partial [Tremellales sp. Uapishka_1]